MTTPISRQSRRAMALPAVLVLVFVGLGIALAIRQFSSETYRRTSRGTYATMSEVLAESAAEEAWYTLQRDVNVPGTSLFAKFRSDNDSWTETVALPTLKAKLADPQFGGYLTDRFDANSSFTATISMKWTNPYGNKMPGISAKGEFDAQATHERVGLVTITGSAQASARAEGLANFRRMVIKRPFRITKVSPPAPFDRSGLIILYPEHVTDVQVAGLLDEPTRSALANGGKSRLTPLLEKSNRLINEARNTAKSFNDAYKLAVKPPFGSHMVKPPPWLQKLIDQAGGLINDAAKVDLMGQGRRPFLFNDQVMIARSTMEGGKLGKLSEFNYGRNMREKLGPLNSMIDGIQKVAAINNKIVEILSPIHVAVPYGPALQAMVAPLYAIVPELVGTVKDICIKLHENLLDPVLEICVGVGQVLAIVEKIVVEVPMMGQQAFAGFANQIANAAGDQIQSQIGNNLDLNNINLQGLPTNTPAMAFSLDMPLPNYGAPAENKSAPFDAGDIIASAGEGVMQLLLQMVEREVTSFITSQLAALTAKITVATTVTAAACAGPQAIVTCAPAKAALALAFELIQQTVMKEVEQKLRRIGSMKGNMAAGIVTPIMRCFPVFKGGSILGELQLEDLLSKLLKAAWEKEDISEEVEAWLNNLLQTMTSKAQQLATSGFDDLGGVVKGYVMRHRFRNLIEFDGSGSMGNGMGGVLPSGGGMFAAYAAGPSNDGMNLWRDAFDRVYRESTWAKKATWKITKRDEWDALLSRYFEGKYLTGKDPSGDGTAAWRDDSYGPNTGYGISGIVYYTGTEELRLDFQGSRNFIGKCVIYAPNAPVNVVACKLRDVKKDCLTVICGKPVTLPPTDVEISVHCIGNSNEDCQLRLSDSTKILGSVVLKRYSSQNEDNDQVSLKGDLTYNERLNGMGADFGDVAANHLFVSVSPYVMSREMETQP